MILQFPSFDALELVIRSRMLDEAIYQAPVRVCEDPSGGVLIKYAGKIPRTTMRDLKDLGVANRRSFPRQAETRGLPHWYALQPVKRLLQAPQLEESTTVLFVLPETEQLAEITAEILRLGNDRQSFRVVEDGDRGRYTLLRVVAPPYYSLLRAFEERNGLSPRAFVERHSRVWVELGFEHPLSDRLEPSPGQWVFLDGRDTWWTVPEAPFRDIYEILTFRLPEGSTLLAEETFADKVDVAIRLAASSSQDMASLWVMKEDGHAQVQDLMVNSDNELIDQLSFAVASDGKRVVVRARNPARPPVMVLDAVPFRRHTQLPNLFVPCDKRLHPPLRRDVVQEVFKADPAKVIWAYPTEGDSFLAETVDDSAFMPMSEWVQYTLDRSINAIQAWMRSHQFDFESFTTDDSLPSPGKRKKIEKRSTTGPRSVGGELPEREEDDDVPSEVFEPEVVQPIQVKQTERPPNSQLQQQLAELEEEFVRLDEPIDGPRRRELWSLMGNLNANLEHRHDTTLCWSQALWYEEPEPLRCLQWLDAENQNLDAGVSFDLQRWLDEETGASHGIFVAFLYWTATQSSAPTLTPTQIARCLQTLQQWESTLPLRAAWLGWCALYQLSGKDVLALAKARDRLLARLHQHGMMPDFDMPTFLRVRGSSDSERFKKIRDRLKSFQERIELWIEDDLGCTNDYAGLIFAFAQARLGEGNIASEQTKKISERLKGKDPVHDWLCDAFSYRINNVIQGEGHRVNLSRELLTQLGDFENPTPELLEFYSTPSASRLGLYLINRLRERSRILRPQRGLNPFEKWHQSHDNDVASRLAELENIVDDGELRNTVLEIIAQNPPESKFHTIALIGSLDCAARLGSSFADSIIAMAKKAIQGFDNSDNDASSAFQQASILHRAIYVAAHFGDHSEVAAQIAHLIQLIPTLVKTYVKLPLKEGGKETAEAIETLIDLALRDMRKLGMREEMTSICTKIANELTQLPEPSALPVQVRPSRLKLSVASGWYCFDRHDLAVELVDGVRTELLETKMHAVQRRLLGRAYVETVAQAPIDECISRMEELFVKKSKHRKDFTDEMTTMRHFSVVQLELIEATVLALVSDEFSLDDESRRWLDEDEFMVRQRIHRDVQAAMNEV